MSLGKLPRGIVLVVSSVSFTALLVTPAFAATAFPTRDDALARPDVVVESGQISTQYRIGTPPSDATYDLRNLASTAYPSTTNYPLSFGKDAPGIRTVVVGGTVLGQASPSATWQDLKASYDGTALLMFGQDYLVSYDLRADDVFDFFRPRPPTGELNGASFLIDGCYGTNVRDDAIENDHEMTGTVRNCLFDGISMGISIGQNETNPSAVTTIDDSTFIFKAFPNTSASDGMGHGVLFKQMGGGQVVMHDDLVCYPETPIGPQRLLNWMPGTYDNVTIVLGSAFDGDADGDVTDLDHPGTLPPGVSQTRDWSLCDTGVPPPPPPALPSISGMDPASGPVGTPVTVTGSGFSGATDVSFGGVSAGYSVVSDTQITTSVTSGATTGPITVTTAGGTATSSVEFTVTTASPPPVPAPTISAVDPTAGPFGTPVTITGTNFTGATAVSFNGVVASFTGESDTRITTSVPAGATTGPVSVTTPGGTATSASDFTVTIRPAIQSISPEGGPVGTTVTITGSALAGATNVSFNGVSASYRVDSDSQVTATVPKGATSGPVSVTTPGGMGIGPNFSVTVAPPSITSFDPTWGPVGTAVRISGSNLSGTSAVSFNGVTAGFTVLSDTQVSTNVPVGATTGPISVSTLSGTATSSSSFTVTAPPSISSISPSSGPVGTAVTITGSALSGASNVSFNGVSAAYTVVSDTQISTSVPSGATSGAISLTTAAGTASSPSSFTVLVPATLTFGAAADTYVAADQPRKNFGTATTIQVDNSPIRHTLIRFTVSGVGSRAVQSVTLRLYCTRGSTVSGGSFSPVADSTWGEKTVTWNTAPAAGPTAIASVGPVATKTWVSIDLTGYVTGDGTYSLRVSTPSANEVYYASRQATSSTRPQLVVVVLG